MIWRVDFRPEVEEGVGEAAALVKLRARINSVPAPLRPCVEKIDFLLFSFNAKAPRRGDAKGLGLPDQS
jgi:hypothetical protein